MATVIDHPLSLENGSDENDRSLASAPVAPSPPSAHSLEGATPVPKRDTIPPHSPITMPTPLSNRIHSQSLMASPSPERRSSPAKWCGTIVLPKSPHHLSHSQLANHLFAAQHSTTSPAAIDNELMNSRAIEYFESNNAASIALIQELSRQLEIGKLQLETEKNRTHAREMALLELLGAKDKQSIDKVLEKAATSISTGSEAPIDTPWKCVINPAMDALLSTPTSPTRPALFDAVEPEPAENLNAELQEAMSDNSFSREIGAIPSAPSSIPKSPAGNRRTHKARQSSLSARLFAGKPSPQAEAAIKSPGDPFTAAKSPSISTGMSERSDAGTPSPTSPQNRHHRSSRSGSTMSAVSATSTNGLADWAGSVWKWRSWKGSKKGPQYMDDSGASSDSELDEDETCVHEAEQSGTIKAQGGTTAGDITSKDFFSPDEDVPTPIIQKPINGADYRRRRRTNSKNSEASACSITTTLATETSQSSIPTSLHTSQTKSPGKLSSEHVPEISESLTDITLTEACKVPLPSSSATPSSAVAALLVRTLSDSGPVTTTATARPSLSQASSSMSSPLTGTFGPSNQNSPCIKRERRRHPSHYEALAEAASEYSDAEIAPSQMFNNSPGVSSSVIKWTQALISQVATDAPSRIVSWSSRRDSSPALVKEDLEHIVIGSFSSSNHTSSAMTSSLSNQSNSDFASPETPKARQASYLFTAKGTLNRALGMRSASTARKKSKTQEPNLTLPATVNPTMKGSKSHYTTAIPPSTGAETSVELDTYAPEVKPPALSNSSSYIASRRKEQDGKRYPVMDCFGFLYDMNSGTKLLKVARGGQAIEDIMSDTSSVNSAVSDLSDWQSTKNKAASIHSADSTPFDAAQTLVQELRELNDGVEQQRKADWDDFLKQRRAKLAKIKPAHHAANGSDHTFAPLNTANEETVDEMGLGGGNLIGIAAMGLAGQAGKQDWKKFKQLVRRGIPIKYRPAIWAECSGASEIREPGYYHDLLLQHEHEKSACLAQIDMDCHRTFPNNVFFGGDGPGVAKLRRLLVAYSWRDPSIGYCQGMNMLAALLLLTFPTEEDAFWVFTCLIERILPSDYFSSQLLVSQADQRVLQDLVQIHQPELFAHFFDLGVELPAVSFGWFLSLFTDGLPVQTLVRVWDILLVYGPITLFRISLAILSLNSDKILACDSAASLYVCLRTLTTHLYQVDKLLNIAFDDFRHVKSQDIAERRTRHVNDLLQNFGVYA